MNVASTEFPLRTNNELIQILSIYNASNEIEIVPNFPNLQYRIGYSWIEDHKVNKTFPTKKIKSSAPHFKVIMGLTNSVLHRDFVDYAVNDPRVKDFQKWLEDTWAPDET